MDRSTLQRKSVDDLRQIATQLELTGFSRLRKAELIDTIIGEVQGDDDAPTQDDRDAASEGTADAAADRGRSEAPDGESTNGRAQRDEVIARRRSRSRNRDESQDDQGNDERSGGARSKDDRSKGDSAKGGGSEQSSQSDARDDADSDDGDDTSSTDRPRARTRDRRQRGSGGGRSDLDGLEEREGVLDLLPEGYGFLRTTGYVSGPKDVYVSQSYVRRFNLRRGDLLGGPVRFNKGNDKFPALARLETCEGEVVENEHDPKLRDRDDFTASPVVFPTEQLVLTAGDDTPAVLRTIDLVAPLGRGQRALLLTPPDTDHAALLRAIAGAIGDSAPDATLLVALIDERPEEITAAERELDAEVVGSPLDAPPEDHTAAAELVVERAKRLVERGEDVVVVLDSLSRLGRAYSLATSNAGRALPGGLDTGSIAPLKQLFGSARNVEDGGSLTILATVTVGTDSESDRTVLDHLRGAGNTEIRIDPTLGSWDELPAIDVQRSGTRRAEALLGDERARTVWELRRSLAELEPVAAWRLLVDQLGDDASLADVLAAAKDASDA